MLSHDRTHRDDKCPTFIPVKYMKFGVLVTAQTTNSRGCQQLFPMYKCTPTTTHFLLGYARRSPSINRHLQHKFADDTTTTTRKYIRSLHKWHTREKPYEPKKAVQQIEMKHLSSGGVPDMVENEER